MCPYGVVADTQTAVVKIAVAAASDAAARLMFEHRVALHTIEKHGATEPVAPKLAPCCVVQSDVRDVLRTQTPTFRRPKTKPNGK